MTPQRNGLQDEETGVRIDLFAHFTTQEFRQAYLSIPLGAKGRRLDPIVNGMLLDAPELFPIYERAAQRRLPIR